MLQDAAKLGVNELMQHGYMELRLIIEWARKVPGNILPYHPPPPFRRNNGVIFQLHPRKLDKNCEFFSTAHYLVWLARFSLGFGLVSCYGRNNFIVSLG